MLTANQLAKLKAAGFEWEFRIKLVEEVWEKNFENFVEFKKEHTHTMPLCMSNGMVNQLYLWCNSQRVLKSKLGSDRIARLKNAGFDFEKLEIFSPWELRYMEF
ncbi:MAG: helicase associated domain-containing protein [Bacteroidota bacterium]